MNAATTTTRYALIDSHSGFVWGVVDAADPLDAAALVERDADPSAAAGRSYEEITASDATSRDHYLVYDATALTIEITDGQDDAQIEAVGALPLVARVCSVDND